MKNLNFLNLINFMIIYTEKCLRVELKFLAFNFIKNQYLK